MIRNLLRAGLVAATLFSATVASAEKTFTREDLAGGATRLEESLRREAPAPAGKTAQQLVSEADRFLSADARRAATLYANALNTSPDYYPAWLGLARSMRSIRSSNWEENYQLRNRTKIAAYKAYLVARTPAEEAEALAQLGSAYASDQSWRAALFAYSASLKAAETPTTRKIYDDLREKYGFRYLDYTVTSDSASPRACFKFSESLQSGKTDFEPFVATTGLSNPGISVEGDELCVDGLKHGQSYSFVLRQGIPSNVGETLLKSVDLKIDVRDRAPQVRVTGRNYVLPSTGQEGLPLVSVNTAQLDLEVYRIGDRNIVPTVRSEDFLQQITGYSSQQIGLDKGVKVWSGTLDTRSDINQDIVTTFPVVEAVGKLEPGIYVLTAKPHTGVTASTDSDEYDETLYEQRATQWFVVSDLGLTAFKSKDGIHVLVRSLSTAAAVPDAEVRLLARNNDILATKTLDAIGHAGFDPGLSRGEGGLEPGLVVVSTGSDYNFIDLNQSAFDLSDRGVKGRPASGPVDAYVFSERGVYRPLETVHITAILRDGQGRSLDKLPLTAVVRRPDGVEFRRVQVEDQGLGGRELAVQLPGDAAHGTWRVAFYTDPKGSPAGSSTFLVEDYVAERLEVALSSEAPTVRPGEQATIDIDARYLFGAPGSGLAVSGQFVIQAATESAFSTLKGYSVGLSDETFQPFAQELEEQETTDDKGHASIGVEIPDMETARPSEAKISLRVSESGGRATERSITIPILPKGPVIGVRKKFDNLAENQPATFDIVVVDTEGALQPARNVKWTLSRIQRSYQWFSSDGRWNYEAIENVKKVGEGSLGLDGKIPASISAEAGWGRYRLDVSAPEIGVTANTSIVFTVGYSGDQTANTPDLLELTTDKASYKSGDTMQIQLSPRFDGKATIAVISDKIYDIKTVDVSKSGTVVTVPVKAEWGAGAYLVALAHRPLDVASRRLPGRALGLTWFEVDKSERALTVTIEAPSQTLPGRSLTIPVKVSGIAKGEEAYVTLAAVDVGILNLTRYESPDPTRYFFGQKQLSADIIDLYGYLIDGMQGTRGAFRSGGDSLAGNFESIPPTEEPLALFSGIVKVGADGVAHIPFELPAFNGTGRLMAVAWSKSRVGNATLDMNIRDPVVTTATLPRFLAIGDQSRLFLQIDNVDGPAGDYIVSIDIDGPVIASSKDLYRPLKLERGQKATLAVPITAAGNGIAKIGMSLKGPKTGSDTVEITRTYKLGIVPGTVSTVQRIIRQIEPGASMTLSRDIVSDILPGTGAVTLSVSTMSALDVPGLLQRLDRYPYGCTEQLVSRALPLVYLNSLAASEALAADEGIEERIRTTIERVLSRQGSNGSFGLWSAGGGSYWLDAFVVDFLTRAREARYAVPDKAFSLSLDRLRNYVANTTNVDQNSTELAYAAYVLARNGRPVMGDLRYLADTKLGSFRTPLARGQIAAALALLGDRSRSQATFDSAVELLKSQREDRIYRGDYGSKLRDGAGLLALRAEAGTEATRIATLSQVVDEERTSRPYTSTQENTWMVLAAQALAKDSDALTLTIDGIEKKGALYRSYRDATLEQKPVVISNTGKTALKAVINVLGNPLVQEPAVAKGYTVERSYYRLDGTKVDPARVVQNTRLVTVLTVSEPRSQEAQLLLVDRLPAGFEIDNPALVDSSTVAALPWLNANMVASHTEYRDDRFIASFDRSSGQPAKFSVAYIVRATSPGRFMHPPATAEDMYRPERFGRSAFGTVEITPERQ